MIASANARGASCGRLCPTPPLISRCAYLPDELREITAVFFVAGTTAFCDKVELVPPLQFSLRRQRHLVGLAAADQIPTDRDECLAAFRPQRRDNVGGPRSPITAGEDRLL